MGLTKSELLLSLFIFYAIVTVFIGFLGASLSEDTGLQIENDGKGIMVFKNIITGFSSIPIWINTIIFVPFVVIIVWIGASSLPTFNGGG